MISNFAELSFLFNHKKKLNTEILFNKNILFYGACCADDFVVFAKANEKKTLKNFQ